jgi:Holliday junction resolvase
VRKGTAPERELVRMFWGAGFAASRTPASGSATKNPLPDVIAGNGKRYLSIEVKSSSKKRIYIKKDEIINLEEFSERFGAVPYIGVRFNEEKWAFLPPHKIPKTKEGNYRIDISFIRREGMDFDEFIGKSKQVKIFK